MIRRLRRALHRALYRLTMWVSPYTCGECGDPHHGEYFICRRCESNDRCRTERKIWQLENRIADLTQVQP